MEPTLEGLVCSTSDWCGSLPATSNEAGCRVDTEETAYVSQTDIEGANAEEGTENRGKGNLESSDSQTSKATNEDEGPRHIESGSEESTKTLEATNVIFPIKMSSSTCNRNNSNTNTNGSSSSATTNANSATNNPLTKSYNEIVNEEQCDDNYLKFYQEDGLDADFYEDDAQLPSLSSSELSIIETK